MYAEATDVFIKGDISGVVDASTNVSSLPLTWCKRLPSNFNGIPISTEYILLDTKRSASNYKNVIEERSARFCLDHRSNFMNAFLLQQADSVEKKPIRLGEYLSKGSTTILDCGDHHVLGRFDKGVLLRLVTWSPAWRSNSRERAPPPDARHGAVWLAEGTGAGSCTRCDTDDTFVLRPSFGQYAGATPRSPSESAQSGASGARDALDESM